MPIYVGGQSADVLAHRDLFELLPDGKPALVRWVGGDGGFMCVVRALLDHLSMQAWAGGHDTSTQPHAWLQHLPSLLLSFPASTPASHVPGPCSGVPPDAFSETGQLWGSPLYDWKAHAAEDFAWWRQRISRSMQVRVWRERCVCTKVVVWWWWWPTCV